MADDELRLWRYTASEKAEAYLGDFACLRTVESLLPVVERVLRITVGEPLTDDEIKAGVTPLMIGPGCVPRYKRAHFGEKDAEYRRLKGLEAAATDAVEASALRKAMDACADELIAAAARAGR